MVDRLEGPRGLGRVPPPGRGEEEVVANAVSYGDRERIEGEFRLAFSRLVVLSPECAGYPQQRRRTPGGAR